MRIGREATTKPNPGVVLMCPHQSLALAVSLLNNLEADLGKQLH